MLEKTIVSREESNAIKGLLILLIALGHNSILSFTWNGCEAVGAYFHRNWLYQFHVYVFFMLPFIYNEQPYRKGNLRKYAIRMLWPYIWICLICLAMSLCVLGNPFNGWANLTWTLISGNITLLGLNIGSQFPWFLMTMFALMLLKDLYYSLARSLTHSLTHYLLVGIGVGLWVLAWAMKETLPVSLESPFSIAGALLLLPVCLSGLALSKRINLQKSSWWLLGIFLSLTILLWCYYYLFKEHTVGVNLLFLFVMPISAFLLLLSIRNWLAKSKLLIALGKMSLPIYLYHVLIFNAFLLVVKHFHCPPRWTDGIVVYIATIVISYLGAWVTMRVPFMQRVLFPLNKK